MKGDGEETLQTIGLCRLCAHQLFHSMTHTAHKPAGQPDVILTVRTTQIPMDNRTLSLQFGQPKSRWTTGHYPYSSDKSGLLDNRISTVRLKTPETADNRLHPNPSLDFQSTRVFSLFSGARDGQNWLHVTYCI